MRTIQTSAIIAEDRRLVLQLPLDVTPGEHRVVVVIDESAQVPEETGEDQETPTRREGNVLVYNGKVEGPITDAVQHMREERIQHILGGYEP